MPENLVRVGRVNSLEVLNGEIGLGGSADDLVKAERTPSALRVLAFDEVSPATFGTWPVRLRLARPQRADCSTLPESPV